MLVRYFFVLTFKLFLNFFLTFFIFLYFHFCLVIMVFIFAHRKQLLSVFFSLSVIFSVRKKKNKDVKILNKSIKRKRETRVTYTERKRMWKRIES